jgi:hypothetical protein
VKKIFRVLACIVIFIGGAALAAGLGGRENRGDAGQTVPEVPGAGELQVRVTGRVRMVGSGPLTELVISGEDREWYVDKKDEAALRDLQQRTVTVEGTETYADLTFANGFPAGRRYTLKNVILVKSEETHD